MSSTLGSPTNTCWKRRSSAGSFSMFSRYSSSVVAPTRRSSPRASIGLSMLPASIDESPPAPAPTTVWISSMNVTISPSEFLISSRTALRRSSNSPRYFAPATIAPRSREMRRLSRRLSGTSPATMRCARPSTTAVLPTPGSPMRTGLFFVRRLSTCTTRRISLSRPMTGSSLPSRARAVRSVPNFSSASNVPSGSAEVTLRPPRVAGIACSIASAFSVENLPVRASASSRWSVEVNASPMALMSLRAFSSTLSSSRLMPGWPTLAPELLGNVRRSASACAMTACGVVPVASSSGPVVVSVCSASALRRCAGSIEGLPADCAAVTAAERASCAFVVS